MKKILFTVFLLIFTTLSANATTTFVHYNVAGAPVSVSHGWNAPVSMRRAQTAYNRSYPHRYGYVRPARPARPARPCGYYNSSAGRQYYNNNAIRTVSAPVNTISRLNKDYTIRPRRSYVANGIRYYN